MSAGIRTTEGWTPNEATQSIFSRVVFDDFVKDIDWDAAVRRLNGPEIPDYVKSSIHGIAGGYSIPESAATWDPVVKEIFAEYFGDESTERDDFCARVADSSRTPGAPTAPERILDAACGTGESTLAWRRRFPDAHITAFDVSPFMLAVAERKLAHDHNVELRCLNAETLPFDDASFDLVTASLLFHELPEDVSPRVLAELARVCKPNGQIAVQEPYEVGGKTLKPIPFPEPYLKDYLNTDWDVAFKQAGFEVTETTIHEGWIRIAKKVA